MEKLILMGLVLGLSGCAANIALIRCVFDFNEWSNSGLGECQRNDGRLFDLTVKR